MEEQRVLKRRFILHIIYNMMAFSIIFMIFGGIMFLMVRNITFSSVDNQLLEARQKFVNVNEKLEVLYNIFGMDRYLLWEGTPNFESSILQKIDNPQIIGVLRDQDGKILNEDDLGKLAFYEDNIAFDKTKLDTIYPIKVGDKYNYRAFNFFLKSIANEDGSQQERYIQLLINVDSEISLIANYQKLIVQAIMMGIVMSRSR